MAATITIGGVDKTDVFQSGFLDVDKRFASEMATLRVVDMDSTAGAYRPGPDETLRGLHNGGLLLGGPIVRVTDRRAVDDVGTVTVIEARDWTVLADRVFVSLQTFPSQTALDLFDELVTTYLADLGVTNISGATTGGPTLPELIVDNPTTTLRQVLDQITAQCGWPWRINGDKQAALVEPGSLPGPVTLDETNVLDGWTWQKETIQNANRVFLLTETPEAGPGPHEHFETRTADGVRTVFPVNVLPTVITGGASAGETAADTSIALDRLPFDATIRIGARFTVDKHTTVYTATAGTTTSSTGTATVAFTPGLEKDIEAGDTITFLPSAFVQLELNGTPTAMDGAPWVWDEQESAMVNPSSAPAVGVEVVYRTWVTLGTWIRVWETSSPDVQEAIGWFDRSLLVDGVIDANGHTDLAAAAAYGRDVLTRKLIAPKRVTLRTHVPGWYPLLTATLDLGDRLVDGEYLVEAVRVRDVGIDPATTSEELVYELELIEGDDIRNGTAWIDYFRGLNPQGGIKWGVEVEAVVGCTGTSLHEDDFESGTALSADYTVTGSISKVAAIGEGGTQGLRATGQYDNILRQESGRYRTGCVSFHSKTTVTDGYGSIIDIGVDGDANISLYRNDDTIGDDRLELYYDIEDESTGSNEQVQWDQAGGGGLVDGWTPDAYTAYRLEWAYATPIDPVPGAAPYLNADGYVRVIKAGATVYEATGIRLSSDGGGADYQRWGSVMVQPHGDLDNLVIKGDL